MAAIFQKIITKKKNMGSFFNKKNIKTEIPNWASFFENSEYSTFIYEIENYFRKLNIVIEIFDGIILVTENDFGFSNLGLSNVAQNCKQDKPKNYKDIIKNHFDSLIAANKFEIEFEKITDNFEEVKKYIGIRLYNEEYIDYVGKEFAIGKEFEGDIYSMLVFDFPHSIVNIKPEQINKWGKSIDELFEIGLQNIKDKYPLTITKENFNVFDIWFANSEHFFTPNIVFDLENRKELTGSKGLLIGIPHRHSAIIYPIENLEVIKAINGIFPAIYNMNVEGPGSLSNKVFWYIDGTFTEIPYKMEDGKLQLFPPDNFLKLLNELT
ncbi:hypothetical protein D0809_03110 [Flavobacterium circumlabens]|uniref:Uncharacterized protein n=2 Tax=Flavobacterium circumlabens TaxID=2133765 RepID=A0A4Y7UHS1_9FLAO|nr:hypothetical protein [Flavobacterium circumlabens]TEB46000.1 hypothetical protein D0809_03110 [Flavobacterium circumlabens]